MHLRKRQAKAEGEAGESEKRTSQQRYPVVRELVVEHKRSCAFQNVDGVLGWFRTDLVRSGFFFAFPSDMAFASMPEEGGVKICCDGHI